MIVPSLVKRKETMFGTGHLPQGEEDLYRTQDSEYLAGTTEALASGLSHRRNSGQKRFAEKFLCSFSPCFRREAGSHGKDVKGLIRSA